MNSFIEPVQFDLQLFNAYIVALWQYRSSCFINGQCTLINKYTRTSEIHRSREQDKCINWNGHVTYSHGTRLYCVCNTIFLSYLSGMLVCATMHVHCTLYKYVLSCTNLSQFVQRPIFSLQEKQTKIMILYLIKSSCNYLLSGEDYADLSYSKIRTIIASCT